MKVTIALNAYFDSFGNPSTPLKQPPNTGLVEEFERRGHQVCIVHPLQIYLSGGVAKAVTQYVLTDGKLSIAASHSPISGDVFFVRGIKGNSVKLDEAITFLKLLFTIENQVKLTFNSAESTGFEFKPKQRTIEELPWIPQFNVTSLGHLEDLIRSGNKIIAKPKVGFGGDGVIYLSQVTDIKKLNPESLPHLFFETLIEDNFERRYIFLDEKIVALRELKRDGVPAGCNSIDRYTNNDPDAIELEIVRKVMEATTMNYGCVDFIGDYVLEINGSGTSNYCDTMDGTKLLYNLTPDIVSVVERMIEDKC